MNWQTFWMAVEAVATVGALFIALIILFSELPKFRKEIAARNQEIAARKVEGFKYARELLETEDFQRWYKHIIRISKTDSNEYLEEFNSSVANVLYTIDFVAKLIELEYVDKDLLFYLFAHDLAMIKHAITDFDQMKNSNIPMMRAKFPNGYALLKEASKVFDEDTKETIERLDKDKAT